MWLKGDFSFPVNPSAYAVILLRLGLRNLGLPSWQFLSMKLGHSPAQGSKPAGLFSLLTVVPRSRKWNVKNEPLPSDAKQKKEIMPSKGDSRKSPRSMTYSIEWFSQIITFDSINWLGIPESFLHPSKAF